MHEVGKRHLQFQTTSSLPQCTSHELLKQQKQWAGQWVSWACGLPEATAHPVACGHCSSSLPSWPPLHPACKHGVKFVGNIANMSVLTLTVSWHPYWMR